MECAVCDCTRFQTDPHLHGKHCCVANIHFCFTFTVQVLDTCLLVCVCNVWCSAPSFKTTCLWLAWQHDTLMLSWKHDIWTWSIPCLPLKMVIASLYLWFKFPSALWLIFIVSLINQGFFACVRFT